MSFSYFFLYFEEEEEEEEETWKGFLQAIEV